MTPAKQNAPVDGRGVRRSALVKVAEASRVAGHPVAYADVHAPAGKRRLWWITYRCPRCGASHFGRSRDRDGVTGVRRSGCGGSVWLVATRTYGSGGFG